MSNQKRAKQPDPIVKMVHAIFDLCEAIEKLDINNSDLEASLKPAEASELLSIAICHTMVGMAASSVLEKRGFKVPSLGVVRKDEPPKKKAKRS